MSESSHFLLLQRTSNSGDSPVWFVFAGMGTQWQGMGKKMLEIDVFRESILKSDAILKPYNIHLYDLLMNSDESSLDDIVNSFVGIAATQVYCYYPFSEIKS